MTEELKPGWRWENFEHLRSTVVTAPNGLEYELRPGDIAHPRAQRLLDAMFTALTQRPAAQTEREAPYGYCPECGAPGVTRERRPDGDDKCSNGHRYPSRSAHASLPTQPAAQEMPDAVEHYGTVDDLPAAQATPEPDDAQRRFEAGCVVLEYLRDIGAPYRAVHHMLIALHGDPEAKSKATPEPVGEALQFHPMPEGWPARFRCDSCDGNGEIGELVSSGHFQPPERQTCTDCGGRGWTSEEHAFNADHMREFAEAHALLTRPAPGVPEGWRIFRTHDGLDVHTPDGDACYVESKATGDRRIPEEVLHALCCDLLAAAQAKGGQ